MATGRGDDGTTGLLFGGRVPKDDARTEAYGTVDEAVSCLGLARAEIGALEVSGALPDALAELGPTLLRLQRDLFVAGPERAATPDAWDRLGDGQTRADEAMRERLEEALAQAEAIVEMPREFIVPGADLLSAALELARSVVDPESGMNVVDLARIKQVILGEELNEVKMILTTPICPYDGSLIQQVKDAAEEAEGHQDKYTLQSERSDPPHQRMTW